jgi:osmotically-inducible protein OsmY
MQADIRQALDLSPRLTNGRGIQVAVNGPTVVLQGNVASQRERRVAELVVRMTPGVRDVRNELKAPVEP